MDSREAADLGLDQDFKTIEKGVGGLIATLALAIEAGPKDKASPEQIKIAVDSVAGLAIVALESFARIAYAMQRQADALEAIADAAKAQVGIWPTPPATPSPSGKGEFKTVSSKK
jgi:hypothetical protein